MHVFLDETGDFNMRDGGHAFCAVVAVVCPDRGVPEVNHWVRDRCGEWGLDELKAAALTADQRRDVVAFLVAKDLLWTAVVTDGRLFPGDRQVAWRRRQAEAADQALARSDRLKNAADDERAEIEAMRKRLALDTRVSRSEYLQFVAMTPPLTYQALQGAVKHYRERTWDAEFEHFHLAADRKLASRKSGGEKLFESVVRPILAGDPRFTLAVPAEWVDDHPLWREHGRSESPARRGEGWREP